MKRIIVAVTGASGVLYGIRALELLRQSADVETHLILSPASIRTIRAETAYAAADVEALADVRHAHKDIGASIASGSFQVDGMLVAPCSVKTLSGIANCFSDDLVTRAADVQLKERRRVVLLFRETPLHAGHIELMARATASGAILMPPVPAFYSGITTLDEAATQTVVALLRYRNHHGQFPAALDTLVPAYLNQVPLDAFDGKPLKYSPRQGAQPLLYSIGRNFQDDAGSTEITAERRHPDCQSPADIVYWPPASE